MADWSLPALTSIYTNTLTEIKNRDIDLALQFDGTTSTSIPTGAIRWTSSANTWQKWTGSAWGALSSTFAFPAITMTGALVHPLGAAATPSITFTGNTNTGIYSSGADQVAISTNGTRRLFVDASGTVSILTGSLSLGPTGLEGGQLEIRNTTNTGTVYFFDALNDTLARLFTTNNNTNLQIGQVAGTGGNVGFYTGGTERLRIDSSGKLLVSTSTARTNFFNTTSASDLQVENENGIASVIRNANDIYSPAFVLAKSRSSTNTVVQSGDTVGMVSFQGNDGSEFVETARIESVVDGTPGANDMPGRLMFSTTADGASSPTERFRIGSAGQLGIGGATYGTSGQVLTSGGASAAPTWGSAIVSGTAVASTSGTSIDFTGIPSWVKRVTVMFSGVSTNGTSGQQIQLGTSGGVVTTGYTSGAFHSGNANGWATSTTGFLLSVGYNSVAADTKHGAIVISSIGSNNWVEQGVLHSAGYDVGSSCAGSVTLSAPLNRVRITTVNGTDTFDAGSINILYE